MNEESKRELTIEELEAKHKAIAKQYDLISEQLKKKKQEEAERKQAELALAKENRHKEIEELVDKLDKLISDYCKDYGNFNLNTYKGSDDEYIFPSKLWHWFF